MVIRNKFASCHPQVNGQAKSTNKILCIILTKVVIKLKIEPSVYTLGVPSFIQNSPRDHPIRFGIWNECHTTNGFFDYHIESGK